MSFETTILPLIGSQFPAFYNDKGQDFIRFAKAYYEWMESENQTLYHTRRLNEYRSVDTTIDEFSIHFREKYLYGLPLSTDVDTKFLFKHIKDFLSMKGTEEGIDVFFRLIFGEEVKVFYPADDLLRPSDGDYYVPVYLELAPSTRAATFQGKQITGVTSGATAIVEKVIRKGVTGKYIDVAYITNLQGHFTTGELITENGVIEGAPLIIGSLTNLDINLAGADFEVGDIASIVSSVTGRRGLIRITGVETATGRVAFTLIDGGWGFSEDALVYVSEKVINTDTRTNANTDITDFYIFETVEQPLATIDYTNNSAAFAIGQEVVGANTIANTGSGYVVGITNIVGANGTLKILVSNGTFSTASDVANTTANVALIDTYTNSTATGLLIGANSSAVGLYDVTGTFTSNTDYAFLRGQTSNTYSEVTSNGIATGSGADFSIGAIQDTETVYINTDLIGGNNAALQPYLNIQLNGYYGNVGYLEAVTINSGGTGYTNGAAISFSGGTPTSNATATLSTNSTGGITTVTITSSGNGYDTPPTVSAPGGTGANLEADMFFGYGFPRNVYATLDTVIGVALSKNTYTIGEIASLSNINPGADYNQDPFVLVIEPLIAGYGRRDLILQLDTIVGTFTEGERISQSFSLPAYSVSYNNMVTSVSSVIVTAGGTEYVGTDVVVFTGGAGTGAAGSLILGTQLTLLNVSGTFEAGEVISQATSGATGLIYSANATVLKVQPTSGAFAASLIVTGATSNATANVSAFSNGVVFGISVTDGGLNYSSAPAVSITTSTGSGFTANAVLRGFQVAESATQDTSTGIISTVATTNSTAGSLLITTDDVFAANATSITTTTYSIDLDVDNSPFTLGETVTQQNTNATGVVYSSNSTVLRVIDVDGTFDVSNSTYGLLTSAISAISANVSLVASSAILYGSNTSATIVTATSAPVAQIIRGSVTEVGADYIKIARKSFSVAFQNDIDIVGLSSGASANVVMVINDPDTNPIGLNAQINAVAGAVEGSISDFEVIDSGFAYEELESVDIVKEGGAFVASGYVRLLNEGTGTGYFQSEKGYLNTKYLHDSDYYQEYSYVIRTGLALDTYRQMLKDIMHVAGTKMFGEFNKVSKANTMVKTLTINTGTIISNNSGTILYQQ